MFKITIAIAALAVSASLAISVPWHEQHHMHHMQGQQIRGPMAEATIMTHHQQKHKPEKYVVVTKEQDWAGLGIGKLLESTLFKVIKAPKKLVAAIAGLIVSKLKALNAKGLMKIALLSGLVAVFGAVAAVVAVSVAGFVALITGLWAAAMHFKYFLVGGGGGGKGDADGKWAESRVDEISEFVLGALDKYGEKQ